MTSCSPPSRRGLATAGCEAAAERRPSLTASARDVVAMADRDEETALRSNKETWRSGRLRDRARGSDRRTLAVPWCSASHNRVRKNQQLSGTGDERTLVFLSGRDQPSVKGNKLRIPAQGGRQGGGIERPAQPLATAINVADTNLFAAVVVIGSNPGERCGLFPGDPADLRQAHQDGDGGRLPDAINTLDQIEPLGEIAVLADRGHQGFELDLLALCEPRDILLPGLLETRVATRSEEHTSELQSRLHLVCRLLLEKKKNQALNPTASLIQGKQPLLHTA